MKTWFIIINPTSGNNFAAKRKKKILTDLENLGQEYKVFYTEYGGHEEKLVSEGIQSGYRNFISVGGDGTLHHVTNGALKQTFINPTEITIAVIPVGTGNDWIKNNSIPKDIDKAIEIINQRKIEKLDIGKILCKNKTTYFNILTGIGFDGYVVEKARKLKKYGKSAYLIASLIGFIKYKKSVLQYSFNDKVFSSKSLMAIIGIGKFCGSGMRLTENADAQDGKFDITLVKNASAISLFMNVKKMYNGKLSEHKEVDTYKTSKMKIKLIGGPIPIIQADGELIGEDDFEVEILPLALKFIVG